jgi:hypothetical protein
MDDQEIYEYGFETAQYDLETATTMNESGRWLYADFMG